MGATFTSVNPARPAEVLGTYAEATVSDVHDAVESATAAQRGWARVPVPARAEVIDRCGAILASRKADVSRLVAREAGKILVEAGGDVQEGIDMAHYVAGLGRAAQGETMPSELPDKMGWTTRQPVGIVGMITPWNFPVAIPSWKCFPALLAGNGIVLKPSEHAPTCADELVAALREAGVPPELVQVVHGHAEPAQALVVHPGVRAVSFTGSVPTGRLVASAAMESGPRLVSLELGGKNAMVVLADADLALAADGALFGAFGTAGQRCTSTSRLIVHRAVADELVESLVKRAGELRLGDPTDPATDVGPVIDRRSAERIHGMVEAALAEGAVAATGAEIVAVDGCAGGSFYAPTILRGVQRQHRIAREEVFGPVLSVIEIESLDEAIEIVNESEYGLSAAIYTDAIAPALQAVD
ncbi:MAG TPA: aldehyde dehydrogenase family protein, partial [Acidimicrobiia bacterium]